MDKQSVRVKPRQEIDQQSVSMQQWIFIVEMFVWLQRLKGDECGLAIPEYQCSIIRGWFNSRSLWSILALLRATKELDLTWKGLVRFLHVSCYFFRGADHVPGSSEWQTGSQGCWSYMFCPDYKDPAPYLSSVPMIMFSKHLSEGNLTLTAASRWRSTQPKLGIRKCHGD